MTTQAHSATPLDPITPRPNTARLYRRAHFIAGGLGILLLLILTENNAQLLDLPILGEFNAVSQGMLLLIGAGLLTWGWGAGRPPREWRWPLARRETGILLAILLLALLLRTVALDDTVRALVDEMQTVSAVMRLEADPQIPILEPVTRNLSPYSWLFVIIQQGAVHVFGYNLIGLRMASALIGVLSVVVAYALARDLFDSRTAIITALLLATFPPHIHLSRLAPINILDGLLGPLALLLVLRALQYNRRMDFVLAGMILGLGQYFFDGLKLFFPVLIAGMLVLAWLTWRGQLHGRYRGLLWMTVTACVIAAPLWVTFASINMPLFGRLASSGRGVGDYWLHLLLSSADGITFQLLLEDLAAAFLVYVIRPEDTLFYAGQTALLLPWIVPFVLVGLFVTLRHWRDPIFLLPVWVIATGLATAVFIYVGPASVHYIGVFPALMILAAVGIIALLDRLSPYRPTMTLAGLVLLLAVSQVVYYVALHLPVYNAQLVARREHPDIDDAVFRARALPDGTQIYLVGDFGYYHDHPDIFLRFLNTGEKDTPFDPLLTPDIETTITEQGAASRLAFFVNPADISSINQLSALLDLHGPFYSPYYAPGAPGQFALYIYAPAGDDSWLTILGSPK